MLQTDLKQFCFMIVKSLLEDNIACNDYGIRKATAVPYPTGSLLGGMLQ